MNIEAVQRYVDIASFNYQMDRSKFLFIIEPVLINAEGEEFEKIYEYIDSDECLVLVGFQTNDITDSNNIKTIGIFANPKTDKIIILVGDKDFITKYGTFEATDIYDIINRLREDYLHSIGGGLPQFPPKIED